MTTLKKADLVEKLSARLDMTKRETDRFIDILFEEIAEVMKEEGEINFPGFGKFEGVRRKERMRNDINNKTVVKVPSVVVPVFRPSKILRIYVSNEK